MKANGKTIVVTGGGNGVGRQLTLQLLSKGATVIAVDINEEALNKTMKISKNSNRLFTYNVDISNKDEVFNFAKKAIENHERIDGIINNAGVIQPFINFSELDMDKIKSIMDINFYGTLYMTKAFLPHLLERQEAHIVNISSMGGFLPVPGQSIYGASKAAVKILTESLDSELENTNVNVSVVIPGGIATEIKENSGIESKVTMDSKKANMILSPQKAAYLIIKAMESNRLRTYIGKDCKTMNFLYDLSPKNATKMINKVMSSSEH